MHLATSFTKRGSYLSIGQTVHCIMKAFLFLKDVRPSKKPKWKTPVDIGKKQVFYILYTGNIPYSDRIERRSDCTLYAV